MKSISSKVKIVTLCHSTEGRMIPLVVISNEGISSPYHKRVLNKPAILIVGNIHAGEVEGKESSQMMIRDFAEGKFNKFLEGQIILFIPIFNADGNDKLARNRRDNATEILNISKKYIVLNDKIELKASQCIEEGIKPMDALHLASAIMTGVNYFCTVDDKFLKKAKKFSSLQTKVITPLELFVEVEK